MAQPIRSLDVVDYPMTVSATNAAISLAKDGVEGKSWYICYANWRVSGSAAVGASNLLVTFKDDTTTIYSSAIPALSANGANLSIALPHPIKITEGNDVSYNIAASGAANCIIYANLGLMLK